MRVLNIVRRFNLISAKLSVDEAIQVPVGVDEANELPHWRGRGLLGDGTLKSATCKKQCGYGVDFKVV